MSNHRYNNGDTNHFGGGGQPHGQSPHHSQQQLQQQHAMYSYHSHPIGGITNGSNGHSSVNPQIPSPANSRMDNIMDNFHPHRRPSYHPGAMPGQSMNMSMSMNHAFYGQGHHMNTMNTHHHPSQHSLIHHASSSSLSTMSPSMSNNGIPSPTKHLVGAATSNLSKTIVVHDHDVLSGRGVNIAQHAGNQRFRTLITTFKDKEYCTTYSAGEKRAVALQIIQHIKKLDPPGRFLKRDGRGQGNRGLNGPWDELSEREAIKKTCQALRDCNRQDRQGYAKGVAAPGDVVKVVQEVRHIPAKERAAAAAHAIATEARTSAFNAITIAASNNACTLPKGLEALHETSSNVSMSSSTKRPRDVEANSSTTATTMAETIESGSMTFSPSSYHNPNPSSMSMSSRYSPHSTSTSGALSNSNYHLSGPQATYHYQQQQHSHNPYPHHNHNSPYLSAYGGSNSQNGSYPSATSAATSYLHSNSSNHPSDYNIMPLSTAQAQLFQEGIGPATTSIGNSNTNPRLQQQQNHSYYGFPDSCGENGHQHSSALSIPHVGAHEQQIKKQRTEDTESSTGPSEPSPLHSNGCKNQSNGNNNAANGSGNLPSDQPQVGYDHVAHHPSISNNTNGVASLASKNDSSESATKKDMSTESSPRMKDDVSDTFFHDVDRNDIVDRENDDVANSVGDDVNNDDHSWANERHNTSTMQGSEQFHDALDAF